MAEDKNEKKKQASKNGKNEDKKGGKREGEKIKIKKREKGRYREGVIVGTHSRGASGVVDSCRELHPLVA
jgi:hypothetical protein